MIKSLITKAKKKLHLHTSGQLKQCTATKHVNQSAMSFCNHPQCGQDICENCQVMAPNQQLYCMQCMICRPELQQTLLVTIDENAEDGSGLGDDDDDDDDEMAFDSGPSFTKIGISIDKKTG